MLRMNRAWKDKILSTRKDVVSRDQLNHAAICRRHFVNGDPQNLPTIIPKTIDKTVIWPKQRKSRPGVSRRALEFNPPTTSEPGNEIDSPSTDTPSQHQLDIKLQHIRSKLIASPLKAVKDIEKRKAKEFDDMSPDVQHIYHQVTPALPKMKSPKLTKKLKALQEKSENHPDGISHKNVAVKAVHTKDALINRLKNLLEEERKRSSYLQHRLDQANKAKIFGLDRFKGSPCDIQFYTGMPDYLTFLYFCDFLQPARHQIQSLYYERKVADESYVHSRGREPLLSVQEQIFLVLCRLRQGYRETDLAHRFDISTATVSEIISKWVKHMSHVLQQLPFWAPRYVIQRRIPQPFKDLNYGDTRCIIDCTEIFIQHPSSNLVLQTVLFSTYKNHHTAKGLISISPHGPVSYVSDLYVGSASDFDITKDCGLLNLIESGDHIMADKGFEIQELLDPLCVRVDHPPILRGVQQMSVEQETTTQRIAKLRIHVERAIERVKN